MECWSIAKNYLLTITPVLQHSITPIIFSYDSKSIDSPSLDL